MSNKPKPLNGKIQELSLVNVIKNNPKGTGKLKKFVLVEDIKSACEFYLRYKNNWTLFSKEQPELANKFTYSEYDIMEFNNWLFKLAFKGVI